MITPKSNKNCALGLKNYTFDLKLHSNFTHKKSAERNDSHCNVEVTHFDLLWKSKQIIQKKYAYSRSVDAERCHILANDDFFALYSLPIFYFRLHKINMHKFLLRFEMEWTQNDWRFVYKNRNNLQTTRFGYARSKRPIPSRIVHSLMRIHTPVHAKARTHTRSLCYMVKVSIGDLFVEMSWISIVCCVSLPWQQFYVYLELWLYWATTKMLPHSCYIDIFYSCNVTLGIPI